MSETDPEAPHGRNEDGSPKAPYGFLRDGKTPRKGNRGARPGQRSSGRSGRARSAPRAASRSKTDKQRKETLVGLADMLLVTPLAGASLSPQLESRIGKKHTDALAGDAVIISQFAPHLADGLIVLSQSKPGALAWLDTVEEKAPYLMLANVGLQMIKAFAENHINPNPMLAQSGRLLAQMRMQEMAQAIQQEAAAMGIPTDLVDDTEPTVEFRDESAA